MALNDPLRLGIHEVGHVVVEYVLTGVARACFVYQDLDGGPGAQTGTIDGVEKEAMTPQDHLHLAAGYLGGWAAVHLAIEDGVLPRAPLADEQVAGDHGYIGTDQIYAHWAAVQANMRDPVAIMAQARAVALDVLRPRMGAVVELGELVATSGLVSEYTLRSMITR